MKTQTWWYAIITHDKTFPFTTRISLDKEEIESHAQLFGGKYILLSVDLPV